MARVVVSKIGAVLTMPDAAKRGSPVGEQGETLSVLRRLADEGHRVIYFGSVRGTLPEGTTHVAPHLSGIDEWVDSATQDEHFLEDVNAVALACDGVPDVFVHMLGMEGSSCYAGNVFGAQIHASDARYSAPALSLVHRFRRPRVCVNQDPRSYPKLQEMSNIWPECVPCALLDQCSGEKQRVVGGRPFAQRSVHALVENWWTYRTPRPQRVAKSVPVRVVAHAHIADGCKQRRRDDAWDTILSDDSGTVWYPPGFEAYGKGWEHFSGHDDERFHAWVRPSEVPGLLATAHCQPAVAPVPGFYTGKMTVCLWNWCLPLPYGGAEQPYRYDPDFMYWPSDSPMRIVRHGDLRRVLDLVVDRPLWGETMEELVAATRPDFTLLETVVEDAAECAEDLGDDWRRAWGTEERWEAYGGMR